MNFEIAKRLKEARFPQQVYPNSEYYIVPNVWVHRKDIFTQLNHDSPKEARTSNEFVFKPTLENLIEACGEDPNKLIEEFTNKWLKLHE